MGGQVGVLRAVVPVHDLHNVLSEESSKYLGKSSPKMKEAGTVSEVAPDERRLLKRGFYRAAKGPPEFESHLPSM